MYGSNFLVFDGVGRLVARLCLMHVRVSSKVCFHKAFIHQDVFCSTFGTCPCCVFISFWVSSFIHFFWMSSFSVGLYIYFLLRAGSSVSVSLQSLLLSFQKISHDVVQVSSNDLFVVFFWLVWFVAGFV